MKVKVQRSTQHEGQSFEVYAAWRWTFWGLCNMNVKVQRTAQREGQSLENYTTWGSKSGGLCSMKVKVQRTMQHECQSSETQDQATWSSKCRGLKQWRGSMKVDVLRSMQHERQSSEDCTTWGSKFRELHNMRVKVRRAMQHECQSSETQDQATWSSECRGLTQWRGIDGTASPPDSHTACPSGWRRTCTWNTGRQTPHN